MANKSDYVELGLACANVCKALRRGMGEKKLDDLSPSVREAIEQLTTWVKPAIQTFITHQRCSPSQNCGGDSGQDR